MSGTVPKMKLR